MEMDYDSRAFGSPPDVLPYCHDVRQIPRNARVMLDHGDAL